MSLTLRTWLPAALFLAGLLWLGHTLAASDHPAADDAWLILSMGALLGVVLQRSRFCFFCILREYFEERDSRGLMGILLALAIGSVGTLLLFGGWVFDPKAGFHPPGAHIGPVSWVLPLGALLFGWGMAFSGSCISAHLYRLGEGSVLSPVALLGLIPGFWLGFLAWNTLYLRALITAPVTWLPENLGYAGALALQLGVFALLFFLLLRRLPASPASSAEPWTVQRVLQAVLVERWPAWVGGLGVGLIGVFAYLRFDPLGVTAQIGSLARASGDALGLLPARLEGLDGFSGCATAVGASLLNTNGILVAGLVLGACVVGFLSGEFEIERKRPRDFIAAFLGGVLLGFGSFISLGCTVGTLLSGITAFALSGWIFALFLVGGVWSGLKIRQLWK